MGIFGALTTAVSGLSAQSYALENISGNIANSQTTGFKRVETSFVDLIPDNSLNRQVAGSVNSYSRTTNTIQGQLQSTGLTTNMAISGEGYFIVKQQTGSTDGDPVLSGLNYYTRRGDFAPNAQGYLVNGSGYYLEGLPLDRSTGNPIGSTPSPIRLSSDVVPASATTRINYHASLPTTPATASATTTIGSELMDSALIGQATIATADAATFVKTSVSGGSVTNYDAQGREVNVQMRWAKTASTTSGGTDTWSLYYQSNSTTGSEAWTRIGGNFTFDGAGKLTSPTANPTITGLNVNGVTVGDVELDLGSGGLTQTARADGTVTVTENTPNGYSAGTLKGISVTDTGRLRATYSNGQSVDLYQVALANFANDDGLKRLDGGAFAETGESGTPLIGGSGKIVGGSVEASNVDISDEFTKMIVTQQAYAANTRIVTTANSMLQETINMIR
jgi:flagellar hook protein FlgE